MEAFSTGIVSMAETLRADLRKQLTDFNNHIKYAERLKDEIDVTNRKIEIFSFMFGKYRILLFEFELKDKTINLSITHPGTIFNLVAILVNRGERVILEGNKKFVFSLTRASYYFDNYSIEMSQLGNFNTIIPLYDIDLLIEVRVSRLQINPSHSDHIGGFIFEHTTLSITEVTSHDYTVDQKTLHEFSFSIRDLIPGSTRLQLKAGRKYIFSFFDNITQRIINHTNESYDIDIDFIINFYYDTEKD